MTLLRLERKATEQSGERFPQNVVFDERTGRQPNVVWSYVKRLDLSVVLASNVEKLFSCLNKLR